MVAEPRSAIYVSNDLPPDLLQDNAKLHLSPTLYQNPLYTTDTELTTTTITAAAATSNVGKVILHYYYYLLTTIYITIIRPKS